MLRIIIVILILVLLSGLAIGCSGEDDPTSNNQLYKFDLQLETEVNIGDINAVDENHIWAIGSDYDGSGNFSNTRSQIFFNDGITWSLQFEGPGELDRIYAYDAEHVWATGFHQSPKGIDGTIYSFDGHDWTLQFTFEEDFPEIAIRDIAIVDPNHVWAIYSQDIAGYGFVYFFDGVSWARQFEDGSLARISAVDPNHVWAVGPGQIFFYDGSSWGKEASMGLFDILAVDVDEVYAPSAALTSFYNVISWEELESPPEIQEEKAQLLNNYMNNGNFVDCFSFGRVWKDQYGQNDDENFSDFYYLDQNTIWATNVTWNDYYNRNGPDGIVYFYDGSSWSIQYVAEEMLYGLYAPDNEHVWVGGESGIYLGTRITQWL